MNNTKFYILLIICILTLLLTVAVFIISEIKFRSLHNLITNNHSIINDKLFNLLNQNTQI